MNNLMAFGFVSPRRGLAGSSTMIAAASAGTRHVTCPLLDVGPSASSIVVACRLIWCSTPLSNICFLRARLAPLGICAVVVGGQLLLTCQTALTLSMEETSGGGLVLVV
jgi:hypothetical protein